MLLIENLVGSGSKVKILRLFYEYPNREFSTKEVFIDTGVGFGYGLKCLNNLQESGILGMKKVGKQKRYFLNKENKLYPVLLELFKTESESFPKISYRNRGILADIIERLDKETLILFGSVAAGTATRESDLDMLVVYDEPKRKNYIERSVRQLSKNNKVKIQAIVLDREKLKLMLEKKSELLKSISREKVFLRGDKKILEMIERA
ncbi:MAG: nucleotidyltransferase domain-containing protein [Candidatus Aenigmarchaeota archaeon]|nr:nucleotidyltransferase domain-containing protein [Candidatus Aenigmarchaeota archaeon]